MSQLNTVKRPNTKEDSTALLSRDLDPQEVAFRDGYDDARLTGSSRVISVVFILLACLGVWAYFGTLDEVSTGTGKVIPGAREQIIQSLEGGIVAELLVAEGDLVEKGQILARLDPTKSESNLGETAAKYHAALASSTRLQAEVNQTPLTFPPELHDFPELMQAETRLFETRQRRLSEALDGIADSSELVSKELQITQNLAATGAASSVEVLRLRRQQVELELKAQEFRLEYLVQAREELARAQAEVKSLESVVKGRSDTLTRLTHRSPVRGIVKNIEVTTIGGVVPPNGLLMHIVPLDENLLIEARISPRDIAFIHPEQEAKVKITAYDYSVYGGLSGKVVTISPDTIQDEVKPENYYYRVFIRTETAALENKAGVKFGIVPGMIATVDIKTGQKTIMDYLIKPINRAREALRER
jgi:adhesin transport system membrane fusion protein